MSRGLQLLLILLTLLFGGWANEAYAQACQNSCAANQCQTSTCSCNCYNYQCNCYNYACNCYWYICGCAWACYCYWTPIYCCDCWGCYVCGWYVTCYCYMYCWSCYTCSTCTACSTCRACSTCPVCTNFNFTNNNSHCGGCNRPCSSGTNCCNSSCRNYQTDTANCGSCGNNCAGSLGSNGICCGGGCKNKATDNSHCGSCNNACTGGKSCVSGVCTCPAGQTDCGGVCRNLQTDRNYCGSCSNNCVSTIGSSGYCCSGSCKNFNTDSSNCGGCGRVCTGGKFCSSGTCVCPAGQTDCGGICKNLQTDAQNCGACGRVCSSSASTCCSGSCRNLQTDNSNCGSCGNVCRGGKYCSAGTCICPAGQTDCGGVCKNLQNDAANCGACNRVCPSTANTCCSGACANLQTDSSNCGSCGKVCTGGKFCSGGTCVCPAGQTDCNGICKNLQTDVQNCGACNNACPAGNTCCSGSCKNLQTDVNNCGSCGTRCTGGKTCQSGVCRCPAGQTDCGGVCKNLQTDSSNCGSCGNVCQGGKTCQSGSCQCAPGSEFCGTPYQCNCRNYSCNCSTYTCNCYNYSCNCYSYTCNCYSYSCNCYYQTRCWYQPRTCCDCWGCWDCGYWTCSSYRVCSTCQACSTCRSCSTCTACSTCTRCQTCQSCDTCYSYSCRNVTNDNNNCGGCDIRCAAGTQCCGTSCKNFQTDSSNCGGCGKVCTGGKTCQSGTCKCPAGLSDCNGTCKNLSTDATACGSCNNNCVASMGSGALCCSSTCVNSQTDSNNCGGCGIRCSGGKTCQGGSCKCPSGLADCNGVCKNLNTDVTACGSCSTACAPGSLCCTGACKNPQTDNSNCGGCGVVCSGGKTCQAGSCKCPAGLSDCGGTCKDLQKDNSNCGVCGNACTSDRTCTAGACVCNAPLIDCNGACRNPTNDNNNCGGCDIQCQGGMTCVSSVCKCPVGTTDCNGVCVNTNTDRNNCGACGNVCRDSKMVCSSGTCTCTNACKAPYVLNAYSCDCQCKVACPGGQVVNAETCACEPGVCKQKIASDRQTAFATENFAELDSVKIVGGSLQLQTDAIKLVADKIKLNKAQDLSAVYVQDSGSSTQAIGYLYYDDLIKRGYIDTRGTADTSDDALHDKNSNGIADFHEDLFNLAPRSGTGSRPYVGRTPRCSATFTHDGKIYSAPELGMQGCTVNFYTAGAAYQPRSAGASGCGTAYSTSCLRDARVGRWASGIYTSQVGADVAPPTWNTGIYSDNGLFPTLPNLLEPPVDENLGRGLGNVLFIITDDDGNTNTNPSGYGSGTFTRLDGTTFTVADGSTSVNGVPDYDGSAFEASGEPLDPADNLDPGITTNDADRQRDMGTIPGGKEIVFFQVGYGRPAHNSSGSGTMSYPCLKYASDGHCTLHMASPINVSFSKPFLNLDMNPLANDPIMVRNAGCSNATNCSITQGTAYRGSTRQGWLNGATLTRLNTQPYGWQTMPRDAVVVNRHVPAIGAPKIPHVVAYSPVTDPFRWFLGFEDLTRADSTRDYNDVVLIINKANGGEARSEVMTKDIAAGLENEFSVTKVRFRRDDDKYRRELGTGKWTETDANACLGPPEADITYAIALDCRTCQGSTGNCSYNDNPTWYDLEWTPGQTEQTLDMAELGLLGSQLCWKATIDSPRDECMPRIYNVDVGYEALRAGEYSRSQLIPLANVVTYGTFEQAGPGWNGEIAPKPSRRTYTNREDITIRGHLWMNQVYEPADPKKTATKTIWDAGDVLGRYVGGTTNPDGRSLYTVSTTGTRMSLGTEVTSGSRAFPTSIYTARIGTQYVYDLNQSHSLRTRANPADRTFFRDWLYGWEDRSGLAGSVYDDCVQNGDCAKQANARRAWPLGGLRLSTPAVVTPPMTPPWMRRGTASEQSQFSANFQSKLSGRSTVSYVGAMDGMLHAFAAGQYRSSDDPCTGFVDYRGYFKGNTCTARDYGTGSELFAYAPGQLLPRYLRMYVPGARVTTGTTITAAGALPKQKATVDATASFADMDFGITGQPAWTIDTTGSRTAGAKTVLAMATGPALNTVFALDVTDPASANYPLPLWEAALGFPTTGEFTSLTQWNASSPKPTLWPTSTGTRHSPTMIRAAVGSSVGRKWLTVFPTDYAPSSASYAGTVYIFDTQTGRLLADGSRTVGIIPLEKGEGVAGEVVGADINGDGDYDVLYAASTSGKIFRIDLTSLVPNRAPDRRFSVCVVADAAATLASKGLAANQASLQDAYSPPAINVLRDGSPRVRIFFGTGNNPESALDTQATNYFLFGYEDTTPLAGCSAAKSLWTYKLDAGQNVWGGVSLNSDSVFAITATGNGADACNLGTEEGRFYSVKQSADTNGNAVPNVGSGMSIGGQGVAGGVIYDEQIMYTSATGEVKLVGSGSFNNDPASGTSGTRRTLRWEALPNGRMPK